MAETFDLSDASQSRWEVERRRFAVCLISGLFVGACALGFGVGTEIKVEQQ